MACARPLGPLVTIAPASLPNTRTLFGRTVYLENLRPDHATQLFPLIGVTEPSIASLWDYMPDGPYEDLPAFQTDINAKSESTDPVFYAIIDARNDSPTSGRPLGYITLMSVNPSNLSIEIGHIMFSLVLQRTTGATEAIYLLLKHAFEGLGYRRVEWKCNALNNPSRRAAARLGFVYEGTFRQHMVVKGRSRDTAWFSMLRDEWNAGNRRMMEEWLAKENFGENGQQKRSLREIKDGITPETV
ncbi:acyl-CoA N-acyltransferase [Aspergillus egyptiacus]|nr:acyl-CoA N-acyltransferase [Aspergillus egyptiacus]